MNDRQENFLSMCKAVQQTCNNFPNSWAVHPGFVNEFSVFNTKVSELEAAKVIQVTDIKGYTMDKKAKREELTALALKIAKDLAGYAKQTGNNTLKTAIDFSRSDLNLSRDEVIIAKTQLIRDKAHENLDNLVNTSLITEPMIEQLQELIGQFSLMSQFPSIQSDIKEASTSFIVTVIDNLRKSLSIMDDYIFTLRPDHDNFCDIYTNSREIYDLGRRSTPEPEPVIE